MTNTELFDLLGQIDDKFYEEALGSDSEKPMKITVDNRQPKPLHIAMMSAAACAVLCAGIAGATAFRDKLPFNDSSEIVSNSPNRGNTFHDEKLQSLFEKSCELYRSKYGFVLNSSGEEDVEWLHLYSGFLISDNNNRAVTVFYAPDEDYEPHEAAVFHERMGQIDWRADAEGFVCESKAGEGDIRSVTYTIYKKISRIEYKQAETLMYGSEESNGKYRVVFRSNGAEITRTEFEARLREAYGKKADLPYKPERLRGSEEQQTLGDIPFIEYCNVPDIHSDNGIVPQNRESELMKEAAIATATIGDYTAYLIGKGIRTDIAYTRSKVFCESLTLKISKNGEMLPTEADIPKNESALPFVIDLSAFEAFGKEQSFIASYDKLNFANNNAAEKLLEYAKPSEVTLTYFDVYGKNTYSYALKDNKLILNEDHSSGNAPLDEYKEFPGYSNKKDDKFIMASTGIGDITIRLLAEELEYKGDRVKPSRAYISLSRYGVEISRTGVIFGEGFLTNKLDSYLVPFVLKDGFGLLQYIDTESTSLSYARPYIIKDGELVALREPNNNAPTGTGVINMGFVESFAVDSFEYQNNTIVAGGKQYHIDFESGTISVSSENAEVPPPTESVPTEPAELGEYYPYNGASAAHATISEKKIGGYTIRLLGHDLETKYDKQHPYVEHGDLYISFEFNGEEMFRRPLALPAMRELDGLRLDDYIFTFEMNDGIGFGVYCPFGHGDYSGEFDSAVLYSIKGHNEYASLRNLTLPRDHTPTDTEHFESGFSAGYKIVPEKNMIDFEKGESLIIDFGSSLLFKESWSTAIKGTVSSSMWDAKFNFPASERLPATKAELERWDKVEQNKASIARIALGYGYGENAEMKMSDYATTLFVDELLTGYNHTKLKLLSQLDVPMTGGSTFIIAYDKDDNILFRAAYDYNELCVQFEGKGDRYIFDFSDCDANILDNLVPQLY